MRKSIIAALENGVVLGDGAMGTALIAAGADADHCLDALNLDRPDVVSHVHHSYLAAGAMLLETNTFGANRMKLAKADMEHAVDELNRRGAELARAAAGEERWVAGSMGPLRRLPETPPPLEELREIFAEQALALAQGGVDILLLETFPGLDMLLLALTAAKDATGLPVAAQMVLAPNGRSLDGKDPATCFIELADAGADVVGFNCGLGPRDAVRVLEQLPELTVPLSVFPNAGYPERVEDRLVFASDPEYFGRTTASCADYGATLLGGCCGTDAAHIQALAAALEHDKEQRPEDRRVRPKPAIRPAHAPPPPTTPAPETFAGKLASGVKMIAVELHAPKHLDMEPAIAAARETVAAGADVVTVPENPLATVRLSNTLLAMAMREEAKAETVIHVTGRDRNLIGMQSMLMGLASVGLTNILAMTGDPPSTGASEKVTGVFDLRSYELIQLLETMNGGRNAQGDDLERSAGFCVGGVFNPNTKNPAIQVRRLERKKELGARYFMTQPVYSKERADVVIEASQKAGVPVFVGVMPLASHRNAEFLHNEFPGIEIPAAARERMRKTDGDKERAMQEGVDIAWELLEYAWPHLAGAYIIPPFNRVAMAVELMRRLK